MHPGGGPGPGHEAAHPGPDPADPRAGVAVAHHSLERRPLVSRLRAAGPGIQSLVAATGDGIRGNRLRMARSGLRIGVTVAERIGPLGRRSPGGGSPPIQDAVCARAEGDNRPRSLRAAKTLPWAIGRSDRTECEPGRATGRRTLNPMPRLAWVLTAERTGVASA